MDDKIIDFEKEIARLDEITKKMEDKTTPLEESISLFKEGTEIIKKLEDALNNAEEKVEKIITKK